MYKYCPEQYIILHELARAMWYIARDNIHAITLLLYSNKYLMPKAFYLNIVYFIIFKWNIELLQIFIFELVQYTFFILSVQIHGYIARLFSIEINRKIFITIIIIYIYCMLVREIWKFIIHPRVSYFPRVTPEGNMILVGE
jgi:hypothetical protein